MSETGEPGVHLATLACKNVELAEKVRRMEDEMANAEYSRDTAVEELKAARMARRAAG